MIGKKKTALTISIVLSFVALLFAFQLLQNDPESPARVVPSGALVYAESNNLKDLLIWWKGSALREEWEKTDNFRRFQSSRLYLKLQKRLHALGADASFRFDLDNLISVSGNKSALVLYDIGDLKAVGLTEISFVEAQASKLWLSRMKFQKKRQGEVEYYVEPDGGPLVFAYKRPYLILASDESLMLETLTARNERLADSEKWNSASENGLPSGSIALFLDQERLNQNHYFKRYWIHSNVKELASIRAAFISLRREEGALVERRYFPKAGSKTIPLEEPDLGPFLQLKHEYLSSDAQPDSAVITKAIFDLINRLPETQKKLSYPPTYSASYRTAGMAETKSAYFQAIDEPEIEPAQETMLRANQPEKVEEDLKRAAPSRLLQFSYPLWDDRALFVRYPRSVVIQFEAFEELNQKALLDDLSEHLVLLFSLHRTGEKWIQRAENEFVWPGVSPLYIKFQRPWIVVSNSLTDFQAIDRLLQTARPLKKESHDYRRILVHQGRWKYSRAMRRLDHGSSNVYASLFFSQNLDSLIHTLSDIESVSVIESENYEVIRYELR